MKRELSFVGIDDWRNPVYRDQNGVFWKDVAWNVEKPDFYNAYQNDFYGEPDCPIRSEFEILNKVINS